MATNESVMQKCLEAYDESRALNGLSSVAADLAAKDAQIASLTAEKADLQSKIDAYIAAEETADAAEAQRLADLKSNT